ncbi:MAG: ethanolamine utilization protein [Synergistaceae bacterium]|nr:ethanolamine utilization protein [Synergistaceae bacterium]
MRQSDIDAGNENRFRKIMVIGRSEAGKSTLMAALGMIDGTVTKTESVQFNSNCIDTPGELLESPFFKHTFMPLSCKAKVVLLLLDPFKHSSFSPGITTILRAPSLGVITKIDLPGAEKRIELATKQLLNAGVKEVFPISSVTGEGLDALKARINVYIN